MGRMGFSLRPTRSRRKNGFELFLFLLAPCILLVFSIFLKYYKAKMDPELTERSVFKVMVIRSDGSEQYKGMAFKMSETTYISSLHIFDFLREAAHTKNTQYYLENFQKELVPIGQIESIDENSDVIIFQAKNFRVNPKEITFTNEFFAGDSVWAVSNKYQEKFDFKKGKLLPSNIANDGKLHFQARIFADNIGGPLLNLYGESLGVVISANPINRTNSAVTFNKIESLLKQKTFNFERRQLTFSQGLKYGMNCNELLNTIKENTKSIINKALQNRQEFYARSDSSLPNSLPKN
jgi:hypothetical protein